MSSASRSSGGSGASRVGSTTSAGAGRGDGRGASRGDGRGRPRGRRSGYRSRCRCGRPGRGVQVLERHEPAGPLGLAVGHLRARGLALVLRLRLGLGLGLVLGYGFATFFPRPGRHPPRGFRSGLPLGFVLDACRGAVVGVGLRPGSCVGVACCGLLGGHGRVLGSGFPAVLGGLVGPGLLDGFGGLVGLVLRLGVLGGLVVGVGLGLFGGLVRLGCLVGLGGRVGEFGLGGVVLGGCGRVLCRGLVLGPGGVLGSGFLSGVGRGVRRRGLRIRRVGFPAGCRGPGSGGVRSTGRGARVLRTGFRCRDLGSFCVRSVRGTARHRYRLHHCPALPLTPGSRRPHRSRGGRMARRFLPIPSGEAPAGASPTC